MFKEYEIIDNTKNNVIISIPFAGAKVKVEFTGGNVFKGIRPHLFTRDAFLQKVLDKSSLNGSMYRQTKEIKEDSDLATEQTAPEVVEEAPVQTKKKTSKKKKEVEVDIAFANLGEAVTYIAAHWQKQTETEGEVREVFEEKGLTITIAGK